MPADPFQRARIRIWIDYCNTRLQRAGGYIAHNYEVEKSSRELRQYLVALNEQMQGREYVGDAYSLADITYLPFLFRLERYRAAVDDSLPHLNAWMRRLLNRPAVRTTA
ncbi:MAG: glutathione S-transferase family protein [Candidatus Binatia bacterium]